MAVEIAMGSPLAEALQNVTQPKLVEIGWSTGDSKELSEYIVLMLVNGKTQDQIASELSNDLLGLGPDNPDTIEFSRWLFEQVEVLNNKLNGQLPGTDSPQNGTDDPPNMTMQCGDSGMPSASTHDADMGDVTDAPPVTAPTGPKAMRNGSLQGRDKRMLSHINKNLDRSSDAALRRIKGTAGTGRINTHVGREPPKGPRGQHNRNMNLANGRGMAQMPMPMMQGTGTGVPPFQLLPAQQQMLVLQMYEQQARMMADLFSPGQGNTMPPGMSGPVPNPQFRNGPHQPQRSNRSLFDRVQNKAQRQNSTQQPPGSTNPPQQERPDEAMGDDSAQSPANPAAQSSMEVENPQGAGQKELSEAICHWNLTCTKPDCPFAHQSPAAPPGTSVDVNDVCSFGAACMNRKCVGQHPSPAKRAQHHAEQDCKFWPNCANPKCTFRHPGLPPCRNGADCTVVGCKFTHLKIQCRYDPCLNPACPYKHAEGQKRGSFEDKVWKANGETSEHVSERKFVDETGGEEELILPGSGNMDESGTTESTN